MTPEQQAALVMSQSACMLAELEAMKVSNVMRASAGDAPAYGEDAFRTLPAKYGVDWNSVVGAFRS